MFNIDDIKEEVIEAAQDVITGRLFDEIDSEINSDAKVFKELALESVKFCSIPQAPLVRVVMVGAVNVAPELTVRVLTDGVTSNGYEVWTPRNTRIIIDDL